MPGVGKEGWGVEQEEELGLRITDSSPVTGGMTDVCTGTGARGGSMCWGELVEVLFYFFFFSGDMDSKIMS